MDESRIIKSVKYHVLEQYLNKGKIWHRDELIAYLAAITYPFLGKVYEGIAKYGFLNKDFQKRLEKFCKNKTNKDVLKNLSFESLVFLFIENFCPLFNNSSKDLYIKNAITIIDSITEEGYISIKKEHEVCQKLINAYKVDANLTEYGSEVYVKSVEVNKNVLQPIGVETTSTSEILDDSESNSLNNKESLPNEISKLPGKSEVKEKDRSLIEIENKLNLFWKNNIGNISDYESKMPYVWKLRISYEVYLSLKDLLKQLCNPDIKKTYILKNHSEKLFVYVAEWFKWEYEGRENKALDVFKKNISASDIWEQCNEWNCCLYKIVQNDAHLYSLYALGGMPLRISDSDKLNKLYQLFSQEEEYEEGELVEELESVFSTNSAALSKSLKADDGSLNNFIKELYDSENFDILPDAEDREIKKIIENIKVYLNEGREKQKSIKEYLKGIWELYTFEDEEECSLSFILKVGFDKDECNIPSKVYKDTSRFNIAVLNRGNIEDEDINIPYIRFSRKEDKFIGWATNNYLYLHDTKEEVQVEIYKDNCVLPDIVSFSLKDKFAKGQSYIELYSNGLSGWSTKKNKQSNKAILFPLGEYNVDERCNPRTKTINGETWVLCNVIDELILIDNENRKHSVFKEVFISTELPHYNFLKYETNDSIVKVIDSNGNEVEANIIFGIPDKLSVWASINNKKDRKIKEYKFGKSGIEVSFIDSSKKSILSKNNLPGIGTFNLISSIDGFKGEDKKICFFLPESFIKRDLKNKRIIFPNVIGIKSISYRCPNDERENILNKNNGKFIYEDKEEELSYEYITFNIKTDNNEKVLLNVFRPLKCRCLFYDNQQECYSDIEETINIPYALKDRFSMSVFGEEGVEEYTFTDYRLDGRESIKIPKINTCLYKYIDKNSESIYICNLNEMKFHSLKNTFSRHYYKIDNIWSNNYNIKETIKYFKISSLHNIPFSQFRPLSDLVNDSKNNYNNLINISKLFLKPIAEDYEDLEEKIYLDLHRFANEFGFEWILMPKALWRTCGVKKDFLLKLLETSPFAKSSYSKEILKDISKLLVCESIDLSILTGLNYSNILKCIRVSGKNDMNSYILKNDSKEKLIEKLYTNTNDVLFELYKTLRNKIKK
ncbi:MAG: hypothetical protein UIC45_07895 [Paludibacteraceae bacterium]|nr:hypothetical protein [Paludibacteraceae bacterium]